jgi:hypothetical protein
MDQIEAIESAAKLLLEKAQNGTVSELATAVEKASGAVRLRAELGKLAIEKSKLEKEIEPPPKLERPERVKEYVSLLGPVLTAIVAIIALAATQRQFTQSEKDKREAAEDAQWADTVKTLSQNSNLSPSAIALNPFLKSAKYGVLARNTAVQLLTDGSNPALFDDLFGAAFVPVGWNNLDQVLKLDRALLARGQPLWQKTYDPETETNNYTKLTSDEKKVTDYIEAALIKICPQVASVPRAPRPSGATLDLSRAQLRNCDCGGGDLRGANIEGIGMIWVDLKDANLDNITQFEGAYFYHVAWWEAKTISPELLEYLEKDPHGKYKEGARYGPTDETFTPQQYAAALDRLKHQAHRSYRGL